MNSALRVPGPTTITQKKSDTDHNREPSTIQYKNDASTVKEFNINKKSQCTNHVPIPWILQDRTFEQRVLPWRHHYSTRRHGPPEMVQEVSKNTKYDKITPTQDMVIYYSTLYHFYQCHHRCRYRRGPCWCLNQWCYQPSGKKARIRLSHQWTGYQTSIDPGIVRKISTTDKRISYNKGNGYWNIFLEEKNPNKEKNCIHTHCHGHQRQQRHRQTRWNHVQWRPIGLQRNGYNKNSVTNHCQYSP